jgi:hypothetical protein
MAGAIFGDPDLTSGELLIAQDADALVVERCPVPRLVCRPQNQQAFSHWDVGSNCHGTSVPSP